LIQNISILRRGSPALYVSERLQSRADPAFAQYTGRLLSSLLSSTMHTSYIFLYSQLSNLQISHQLSVTLSNISQRIGPWHQERTSYRNHFAYPIQRLRSLLSTLERSRPSSLFTRSFLASHSPLYPAALKGSNAEAEAKMVDLGEVDVHTFDSSSICCISSAFLAPTTMQSFTLYGAAM
jgi:hypothetical protein